VNMAMLLLAVGNSRWASWHWSKTQLSPFGYKGVWVHEPEATMTTVLLALTLLVSFGTQHQKRMTLHARIRMRAEEYLHAYTRLAIVSMICN